jgi:GTP pyrophosphokinase
MSERLEHPLSDRFEAALIAAHGIHRLQSRKGTQVPYVAHLIGVAGLVLEYGGSETQAIAALLHDAIEDVPEEIGREWVRRTIQMEFGADVLEIVEHCTDTDQKPKPPWLERKKAYVAHVGRAAEHALLVSAADKLHNVRAILRDYRLLGDALWSRFNTAAGRAGVLGYYRALVGELTPRLRNPIVADLDRELTMLEAEAGGPYPWPPPGNEERRTKN